MPNNVKIVDLQSGAEIDELKQEQQLLESSHSGGNLAITKTLISMFKVSSFELGPAEESARTKNKQWQQLAPEVSVNSDEPHWQIRNTIKAKLPSYQEQILWMTGNSKLGRAILGDRVSKLLYSLTVGSLTIWLIAGAYLLFKHDTLLKDLHQAKTERNTLPQTDRCTLKKDLRYLESGRQFDDHQEFLRIIDWLAYLGITLTELTGLGVILTGIISILPVAFHYFSYILLKFQYLRIDHLCFLFDPIGERRRIRAEINKIILNLVSSIQNDKSDGSELIELCTRHRLTRNGVKTTAAIRKGLLKNQAKRFCFIKILIEIYNLNLVQPVNVTSWWHKRLSRGYRFMITLSLITSFGIPLLVEIVSTLFDIYMKTNHRLGTIECQKWNSNGVLIGDFTQLDQLELEHEREAFRLHDGSFWSLIYLVLMIEVRYYFTWRVAIYIFAKIILACFNSIWVACFVHLFLFGHIDKIVWLNQLDKQIGLSIRNAMRHAELMKNSGHNEDKCPKLAKQLTITYINYELFRVQQKHFQKLSNFFISQGLVACAATFELCCIVAEHVDIKYLTPILLPQIATIYLMNIYLILSSYKLKKVEKITKGILRLVIHASNCWPESRVHFIEMWRRQLLSDDEARQFFASSLLGSQISYQRVIYFNAYVLASWILILRLRF